MTLHSVTRGTRVPPWWTYRERHKLGVMLDVSAEAMTQAPDMVLDTAQRILSRNLREEARLYGYPGSLELLNMETRYNRTVSTDPLSPVQSIGMVTTLYPHVWFSSDCMDDMNPIALIEGVTLPQADIRRGSACRCALCVYTNNGEPEGGPDGSEGWRRVGEQYGWLPRPEPGEETPLWDGSDEQERPAPTTFEFDPDEEDDEPFEEECCRWCGDPLSEAAIFTRVDNGEQYHIQCAIEAQNDT